MSAPQLSRKQLHRAITMASLGDVATKARALTHTDTTSYTDANLLIDINMWYQKVADMIFESQDDSDFDDARNTNYPVVSTPMIANQRDYPVPVSEKMLKLKRVDICFDGTNAYRAEAMDAGAWPYGIKYTNSNAVDANFDANFDRTNPRYDYAYGSIWCIPMPVAADVSNGGYIRAEWFRNVNPFTSADYTSVLTDSTAVPGFDAPFHMILAYGAALEKARADQLPNMEAITEGVQDWEARLRIAYGRKDQDMRLTLTPDLNNSYR